MRVLIATAMVLMLLATASVGAAGQGDGAPVSANELFSGMVTEEVAPGVFRVINDGVRDLTSKNNEGIAVGHDDSVWLLRKNRFLRLGTLGDHKWPGKSRYYIDHYDFEVAPDGTVWASASGVLRSFDGEGWSKELAPETGDHDRLYLTVAPDGGVWTAWDDPEDDATESDRAWVVARFDGREWRPLDDTLQSYVPPRLFITKAGAVWAAHDMWRTNSWGGQRLSHYVDGAWQRRSPGTGRHLFVDINGDGIVWLSGDVEEGRDRQDLDSDPVFASELLRFDGTEWHGFGPGNDERIRRDDMHVDYEGGDPRMLAAPDGTVWFKSTHGDDRTKLIHFDGTEAFSYFGGVAGVWAFDIAADGSVWVLERQGDLYVIIPEVSAAIG